MSSHFDAHKHVHGLNIYMVHESVIPVFDKLMILEHCCYLLFYFSRITCIRLGELHRNVLKRKWSASPACSAYSQRGSASQRISPHLMEPLSCWKELDKGPYPQSNESIPRPSTISLRLILISFSHLWLGLSSSLYPLGFLTLLYIFLQSAMRATCPNHLIVLSHSNWFVIMIVFVEFVFWFESVF